MQDRTVRFRLVGKGAAAMRKPDFIAFLEKTFQISDSIGLWKEESPFEYFVVFDSHDSADHLKAQISFQMNDQLKAYVCDARETIQEIKFLWVPLYINDKVLEDFLKRCKISVFSKETLCDQIDGKPTGTRSFKVIGNKQRVEELPHLINFSNLGFQTLIQIPGRPPLCLRCHRHGHLRRDCVQKPPPRQSSSYPPPGPGATSTPRRDPNAPWGPFKPTVDDVRSKCSDSPDNLSFADDESTSEGERTVVENENTTKTNNGPKQNDKRIDEKTDRPDNSGNTNDTRKGDPIMNQTVAQAIIAKKMKLPQQTTEKVDITSEITKNVQDIDNDLESESDENDEHLMKDDGTIACTQKDYFEEKHSRSRKLRSMKKKKRDEQ